MPTVLLRRRRVRMLAGATALAVGASGMALHIARAAQPEVFDLASVAPVTDGLERHVVTFAPTDIESVDGTTTVAPVSAASTSPPEPLESEVASTSAGLDAAVRAMMERGGAPVLRDEDGVVAVADVNGAVPSIPIDGPLPAAVAETSESRPAPLTAAEAFPRASVIATLAAADGVHHALPLPDGTAVVAVTPGTHVLGLPAVVSARPDDVAQVFDIAPNDPVMPSSWALANSGARVWGYPSTAGADVGAYDVWSRTRGAGAVVATIDTGYDHTNTDIGSTLWNNDGEMCGSPIDNDRNGMPGDCHGWNFYGNNANIRNDINGTLGSEHGTAVGGAAVASLGNGFGAAGLAPAAKNMTLVAGSGSSISMSYAAAAIRYAADNGADVINASFGSTSYSSLLHDAIRYAGTKDVLVVAAVGNDSGNRDVTPFYPANYDEPNLLSVGASDQNDAKASFSGYGDAVDLFAPGYAVMSPGLNNTTRAVFGTSIASPLVSATAALMRSVDPSLTARELHDRIKATAERRAALAGLSSTGARLSAAGAVATVEQPVSVSVAGLDTIAPTFPSTATVTLRGSGAGLPTGPLSLRVALGAYHESRLYSVADLPVGGAGITGRDGAVTFTPESLDATTVAAGAVVPLELTLPVGRYVLTAQLVAGTAGVDVPQAFPFDVGVPAPVSPVAPAPSGSTPPAPLAPSPAPSTLAPAPVAPAPAPNDGAPVPGAPMPTTPSADDVPNIPADPAPPAPAPDVDITAPSAPRPPVPPPGELTPLVAPAPVAPAPVAPAPAPDVAPVAPVPVPVEPVRSEPTSGAAGCGTRTFVASANFGVTAITPSCGDLSGSDLITIVGQRIPEDVVVYIGGERASVLSSTATSIAVSTPQRARPGVFEVRVIGRLAYDVLDNAFTYREADGTVPTPAPTGQAPAPESSAPAPAPIVPVPDGSTPAPAPTPPAPAAPPNGASPTPSVSPPPVDDIEPADGSTSYEGLTLVDNGGRVEGFDAGFLGYAGSCLATCTGVRR